MLIIPARRDATRGEAAIAARERVIVDIDSFDAAELDRLLADHAITAPGGWSHWVASTKISWLKREFEAAPDTAPPAPSRAEATIYARGGSKVSLMTSLAALGQPADGRPDRAEGRPGLGFDSAGAGSLAAWKPRPDHVEPDALHRLIAEIDGLDEPDALGSVGRLADQSEVALFRLGGVLARLKDEGWPQARGSFRQFVEAEHGIPYRKAVAWMALYRQLARSAVAWEKLRGLGWSALRQIAGVITPDNVDEWVAVAQASTTRALAARVAAHKTGARKAIAHAEPTTRMSFSLRPAQKGAVQAAIEKAREGGARAPAVALETICANYVSGATFDQEAKAMGLAACLKVIEAAYPNAKIAVALDAAETPLA